MGSYLWITRVPTLERFLSQKLNAKVNVDDVEFGLNQIIIKGLRIKSPSPATLFYAFEGETITIELNFLQLCKNTVGIKQITLQDLTINIELYNLTGSDNNWARLLCECPHIGEKQNFKIDQLNMINIKFNTLRSTGNKIALPTISQLTLKQQGPYTLPHIGQLLFKTSLATFTAKPPFGALFESVAAVPDLMEDVDPFEQTKKNLLEGAQTIWHKTHETFQGFFSNALQLNR